MPGSARIFNQFVCNALSRNPAPVWLNASPETGRQLSQLLNHISVSDIDIPILLPARASLSGVPDSCSEAAMTRKLFQDWVTGSGRTVAQLLLPPHLIQISLSLMRWQFTPAAQPDVLMQALSRGCPHHRHAWIASLLSSHSTFTSDRRMSASSAPAPVDKPLNVTVRTLAGVRALVPISQLYQRGARDSVIRLFSDSADIPATPLPKLRNFIAPDRPDSVLDEIGPVTKTNLGEFKKQVILNRSDHWLIEYMRFLSRQPGSVKFPGSASLAVSFLNDNPTPDINLPFALAEVLRDGLLYLSTGGYWQDKPDSNTLKITFEPVPAPSLGEYSFRIPVLNIEQLIDYSSLTELFQFGLRPIIASALVRAAPQQLIRKLANAARGSNHTPVFGALKNVSRLLEDPVIRLSAIVVLLSYKHTLNTRFQANTQALSATILLESYRAYSYLADLAKIEHRHRMSVDDAWLLLRGYTAGLDALKLSTEACGHLQLVHALHRKRGYPCATCDLQGSEAEFLPGEASLALDKRDAPEEQRFPAVAKRA